MDSEEVVDVITKIDYRLVDLTADPDKSIILRIKDKEAQIIKVLVTNKDDSVVEKYYSTSTLDYEGFEVTSNFGDEEPVINGKKPSELQDKLSVDGIFISGTLRYVRDYEGYSDKEDEQSGNYLALKLAVPYAKSIKYGITDTKTLEATEEELAKNLMDRNLVLRVNKEAIKSNLVIDVTYQDGSVERRNYMFAELKFEAQEDSVKVEVAAQDYKLFEKETYEMSVSSLQNTDIEIEDPYKTEPGRITGTLKKVYDWAAFDKTQDSGHYLALKITAEGAVKIEAGTDEYNTADKNGVIAVRIDDKNEKHLRVRATYEGGETLEKEYEIDELELQGFALDFNIPADKDLNGKKVADLQKNMEIEGSTIYGTLLYVNDYSSAFAKEQSNGYYLALHTDIDAAKGEKAYLEIDGKKYQFDSDPKQEPDGIAVLYIPLDVDFDYIPLKLIKEYKSGATEERDYELDDLIFQDISDTFIVTVPDNKPFGEAFDNYRPSDIQRNITVYDYDYYDSEITGKLKLVENWKAYGEGLSSGHYIALKVDAPGAEKVIVSVVNGDGYDADITNDPDKTAILRIRNKDSQLVRITAYYKNGIEASKAYDLEGLTLEGFDVDPDVKGAEKYQEGIYVGYDYIEGILKYVEDDKLKGNYINLHTDLKEGETASLTIGDAYFPETEYNFDKDGNVLAKVPLGYADVITFKKTYKDGSYEVREYEIDELELGLKDEVNVVFNIGYEDDYDPETQRLAKGYKAEEPSVDPRDGYKLEGWFEEGSTTAFDFDKPIEKTGTIILTAKWTPITFTVRFNENGGIAPKEAVTVQKFVYDVEQPLNANVFEKEGYNFVGWAASAFSNEVVFTDKQVIGNITREDEKIINLYAVWTAKKPHSWTPTWTWEKNYKSATLTLTCQDDILTFNAEPVQTITYEGYRTYHVRYYAEVIYEGIKYSDYKAFLHSFGGEDQELDEKTLGYTGNNEYLVYNGKNQKLSELKVFWGASLLVENTDYTLKYKNNKDAGKASVLVQGKGQYEKTFSQEIPFTIEKADISDSDFSAEIKNIVEGQAVSAPVLKMGNTTVNKKFYTVSIEGGIKVKDKPKAGKYTVTLKGDGKNFTGERTLVLTVADKNKDILVDKLKVTFDNSKAITQAQVEDVEGYMPKITLANGKASVASTDKDFDDKFELTFINNRRAGTAYVEITALDGCKIGDKNVVGSVRKSFKIPGIKFTKAQKNEFNVIKNKSISYTGQEITIYDIMEQCNIEDYAPSLLYYGDYRISYSNNFKKGTMYVIVQGIGIYDDTLKIPVKIVATTDYKISFNELVSMEKPELNKVAYNKGGATVTGLTVAVLESNYILREGVDYTVSYKNNKKLNAKAELVINGKGNYGKCTIPFTVVANEITATSVYTVSKQILAKDVEDTKAKIKAGKMAAPVVIDAATGKKLTANKDFTYKYGEYDEKYKIFPVTISGGSDKTYIGEYTLDGVHVYTTALKTSGKGVNVALNSNAKFYYTGKAIALTASDFDTSSGKAVLGKDFIIVGYKNNIKAGTATVTIKAIGDTYGGTAKLSFKIQKATKPTVK
jgi:uncharacterized repeat protein (TIGR02543 family)